MSDLTKEHIEHLKEGVTNCLVCDNPLSGAWTDYNGQLRCNTCGTTYQVLGSHLSEQTLSDNNLVEEDIAQKYCDVFDIVPILKDYYTETGNKVPLGTYLGDSPIPEQDHKSFSRWLATNADKYREDYPDDFYWDKIIEKNAPDLANEPQTSKKASA